MPRDFGFPVYQAEFHDGEYIAGPSMDNQRMRIAAQTASRFDGRDARVKYVTTLTPEQAKVFNPGT